MFILSSCYSCMCSTWRSSSHRAEHPRVATPSQNKDRKRAERAHTGYRGTATLYCNQVTIHIGVNRGDRQHSPTGLLAPTAPWERGPREISAENYHRPSCGSCYIWVRKKLRRKCPFSVKKKTHFPQEKNSFSRKLSSIIV